MKFLLIIMTFLTMNTAFAQDSCSDVEVDTSYMPKNNNQNQHNWCVFWTGADLFSFYEKQPLSSFDMALQYFNNVMVRTEDVNDYTDVGANMTAALIIAQQGKGLCEESQTNFTNSDWSQLSVLFKHISSSNKKLSSIFYQNKLRTSAQLSHVPDHVLRILDKLSGDKRTAALLDVACGERYQMRKYSVGKIGRAHV